jgi:hypothetical protein
MPTVDEEVTQPEVGEEVYDESRALKTMAKQVASLYSHLPTLIDTVKSVVQQQQEHERRLIRLEGKVAALEGEKAAE